MAILISVGKWVITDNTTTFGFCHDSLNLLNSVKFISKKLYSLNIDFFPLLPPANKVCKGYDFTHVCLSTGGFQAHTQGEVEGSGYGGLQAHTWGGSPGPHLGGYPGPHLGGVQAQA